MGRDVGGHRHLGGVAQRGHQRRHRAADGGAILVGARGGDQHQPVGAAQVEAEVAGADDDVVVLLEAAGEQVVEDLGAGALAGAGAGVLDPAVAGRDGVADVVDDVEEQRRHVAQGTHRVAALGAEAVGRLDGVGPADAPGDAHPGEDALQGHALLGALGADHAHHHPIAGREAAALAPEPQHHLQRPPRRRLQALDHRGLGLGRVVVGDVAAQGADDRLHHGVEPLLQRREDLLHGTGDGVGGLALRAGPRPGGAPQTISLGHARPLLRHCHRYPAARRSRRR